MLESVKRKRIEMQEQLELFAQRTSAQKTAHSDALVPRFVFFNNKIDGHGTRTLSETIAILSDLSVAIPIENDPSWSNERRECANQVRAWQCWQQRAWLFDAETICHVHALLVAGDADVTPGVFRDFAVRTSNGAKIYVSHDQVHRLMDEWLVHVNELLAPNTAICRYQAAALAMTMFAEIHPFGDGNGRLSRLIANAVLQRLGFPVMMVPKERKYLHSIVYDQKRGGGACLATTAWMLNSCVASLSD